MNGFTYCTTLLHFLPWYTQATVLKTSLSPYALSKSVHPPNHLMAASPMHIFLKAYSFSKSLISEYTAVSKTTWLFHRCMEHVKICRNLRNTSSTLPGVASVPSNLMGRIHVTNQNANGKTKVVQSLLLLPPPLGTRSFHLFCIFASSPVLTVKWIQKVELYTRICKHCCSSWSVFTQPAKSSFPDTNKSALNTAFRLLIFCYTVGYRTWDMMPSGARLSAPRLCTSNAIYCVNICRSFVK